MSVQFPSVILVYIATTIIAAVVAYKAWNLRPARGSAILSFLAIGSGLFAITNALGAMVVDLLPRLIILQLTYISVIITIYFWIIFTIEYSQYDYLLTRNTLIGLAVVPVFIALVVLTIPWHTMFYTSMDMVPRDGYMIFRGEFSWAFWLWVVYAYLCTFTGTLMLVTSVLRFPHFYRGQAGVLVLSGLIPIGLNLVFIGGIDLPLFGRYDPSPFGYAIAGLLILIGMRRYQLFSMVPVAHDLVFKAVKSAVIVIDNNGIILDVNPTAEQILNQTAKTILGQELIQILPNHQEQILSFKDVHNIKTEIAIAQRMYELQIMPFSNRVGRVSGRIIMLYDITELKQALDELDAYAHTVAHDLKSPVSGMITYADYIKDELLDEETDDELHYSIESILKSGKNLQDIIESLLLLASVRRQKVITYQPIDMSEAVDNALGRLTQLIDQSGVEIIQPTSWHSAVGHGPWIEEIWANYISNGIKYGGRPPVIELGCEQLGSNQIRFWVKDNGTGLYAEDQAKLFTTFTRLEQHAKIKGHGLGLSIVQRIANRLHGQVGVTSEIGVGSTFYFVLPANPHADASQTVKKKRHSPSPKIRKNQLILLESAMLNQQIDHISHRLVQSSRS